MLVPLTRKTFEELIPAVATGAQYGYCWGKLKDLLRRILISVVGMFAVLLLYLVLDHAFPEVFLIVGISTGLYWLWEPVLRASLRNREYRRYGYAGFWQGKVTDVFVSEELVGTEETVNNRGELVVVENRERCLNLEVGDREGFYTRLQVPLKRAHRALDVGDVAEMVVLSNRNDLRRIVTTSDIYIPDHNLWVSDYPYLQREAFVEVSRRLNIRFEDMNYPEPTVDPEPPRRKRVGRSSQSDAFARAADEPKNRRDGLRERQRSVESIDRYADRDRPQQDDEEPDQMKPNRRQRRIQEKYQENYTEGVTRPGREARINRGRLNRGESPGDRPPRSSRRRPRVEDPGSDW